MTEPYYRKGIKVTDRRAIDWAPLLDTILARIDAGDRLQDIADRLGVGYVSLHRFLKAEGIKVKRRGGPKTGSKMPPRTAEHIARQRASALASGGWERTAARHRGRVKSEEERLKISAGKKRSWAKKKRLAKLAPLLDELAENRARVEAVDATLWAERPPPGPYRGLASRLGLSG